MFPIRTPLPRLDTATLARFADTPSPLLADGNGGQGVLAGIQPLAADSRVVGAAVTVHAQPGDNLIIYRALQEVQPGDVLVVRTGCHRDCALIGDIVAEFLRHAGLAALVTDGLVRDEEGIGEVGLPVFCAGTHPAGPAKEGGYGIGYPVVLGGTMVRTGDLVIGDRDGVVVARAEELDAIWERLQAKEGSEAVSRQALQDGKLLPDATLERLAEKPYALVDA